MDRGTRTPNEIGARKEEVLPRETIQVAEESHYCINSEEAWYIATDYFGQHNVA